MNLDPNLLSLWPARHPGDLYFAGLQWSFPSHKMRINDIFADVHMHKQQSARSALPCTQLTHTLMAALTLVHCPTPTLQHLRGPCQITFPQENSLLWGRFRQACGLLQSVPSPHLLFSLLPAACLYGTTLSVFVQIYAPKKGYLSSLQDSKLQDPEFHSHLQRQKLLMAHKI